MTDANNCRFQDNFSAKPKREYICYDEVDE